MIRKLFAYRALLFLLLFMNSACLFLTDDKKAGIPYLRELFILAIVLGALVLLLTWSRAQQSRAGLWIVFFGLVLPLLSALLAALNFGQPFGFGLLEERRSFLYLLFFPMLFLLIKAHPTQEQLERFMLCCAVACVVVGYLYYWGLLPENNDVSFTVDEKDYGINPLRPNRFSIGAPYVSACAFMLMYRLQRSMSWLAVALLLLFASYLWLVIQTRNTMLIWALAGVWIFRSRVGLLVKLGILASAVLLAAFFLAPDFFAAQLGRFDALLFEAREPGVRNITTQIVVEEVARNSLIGMGALSLQWQGGFSRLYNGYFYLSDVGLLGVYYRFGFLTPAIALIYYLGFFRFMAYCRKKGDLLNALQLTFWFNGINFFFSNTIMYGGEITGLSIAAFVYYARTQESPAAATPRKNWLPEDALRSRTVELAKT
ncbi:hypothetical protein AFK24_27300 [Pseudomonas syringae]|uniref:Uncharacterized protein n=1 Tax=Pseudomonas syringae TaxID=317 RepID=A0A1C7Z0D3_PSESX|nr:hypothetical protein [Pseudomonas syringae]OCR21958.1 hypothetical protein AFK24_27300 [Pseudomonas syringae]